MPDTDETNPDDVIASMADEAIDRMLGGGRPCRVAGRLPSHPSCLTHRTTRHSTPFSPANADEPIGRAFGRPRTPAPRDLAEELVADQLLPDEDDDLPAIPTLSEEEIALRRHQADGAVEARPGGSIDRTSVGSTPFWITPLAWLARPLDKAGNGVRDAIGKVALVTLVNASGRARLRGGSWLSFDGSYVGWMPRRAQRRQAATSHRRHTDRPTPSRAPRRQPRKPPGDAERRRARVLLPRRQQARLHHPSQRPGEHPPERDRHRHRLDRRRHRPGQVSVRPSERSAGDRRADVLLLDAPAVQPRHAEPDARSRRSATRGWATTTRSASRSTPSAKRRTSSRFGRRSCRWAKISCRTWS